MEQHWKLLAHVQEVDLKLLGQMGPPTSSDLALDLLSYSDFLAPETQMLWVILSQCRKRCFSAQSADSFSSQDGNIASSTSLGDPSSATCRAQAEPTAASWMEQDGTGREQVNEIN